MVFGPVKDLYMIYELRLLNVSGSSIRLFLLSLALSLQLYP